MATLALLLPLLSLVAVVSGGVISGDKGCDRPLWTVVGNHYVPRETCQVSASDLAKESAYRQKYFRELSAMQENPDEEKITELLERMMPLLPSRAQDSIKDKLMCIACGAGIETYRFLTSVGVPKRRILDLVEKLCVDLNVMTPEICHGALDLYGESLVNIVDGSKADADQMCSVLLNVRCGSRPLPEFEWNVTLPDTPKPPPKKPIPPPSTTPRLKVLHISDTHWDTRYSVGSWAECKLPLCCRKENVLPDEKATKAGKYGGWKCDTPEETFDDMLRHVAKNHPDIDYIIWTGDIPAHDIWDQSRAGNLDVLKKTVAKLSATFPKIPLYPALGNHESVPSNMYPVPKNDKQNPMDWLYDEVNAQWSRWLPGNVSRTVRMGAFYTTLIRPGFRLVSMNMNYCYKMNWWLIDDSVDPLDELRWFVQLLQEAENKKEKVHVIGHIPPGSTDCLRTWQRNYYKVINRYEGTVTAQFFGHTHNDEFELFYDLQNTSRPFGVAYVGPSLTTYTYHNPSYRIYYVEGDHQKSERFVLDHESWYLNLEEANKLNRTEWKKLYGVKDAYKMSSLYPEDWHGLYLRIKNSNATLQLYHKHYWNDSPKRPSCGAACRRNRLCDIRSCALYGDPDD